MVSYKVVVEIGNATRERMMKRRKVIWYSVVSLVLAIAGAYGLINGVWI